MKLPLLFAGLLLPFTAGTLVAGEAADRWQLAGENRIAWTPRAGDVHADHVEMSGRQVSVIATYRLTPKGRMQVERHVVWPMLRFKPNETHDHFAVTFGDEVGLQLLVDQRWTLAESTTRVEHRGLLQIEGTYGSDAEIGFVRRVFPSVDKPVVVDESVLTNRASRPVLIDLKRASHRVDMSATLGIYGAYTATAEVFGPERITLQPGESVTYVTLLSARRQSDVPWTLAGAEKTTTGTPLIDAAAERQTREARVAAVQGEMQLVTPDPVLNTMFAFAKIRATESIFATKDGLMHGPGGGVFYAAIWANDQAEYANPFFGMLRDATAQESALNSYRIFARFMNPAFKPIPSSIIAEGTSFWNGAGDRGDMAMIAYGAGRYALARGDAQVAEELWPLIAWCLEFSRRKITADGVVASDSDELEDRFPSGRANLCTSSLYYDGLLTAARLARELKKPETVATDYEKRAVEIRAAIERYFGANVAGFATYRYFDKAFPSQDPKHAHYANEPDHLRAWICVPLAMGIHDRAVATIEALFSPALWTPDGLATEAGDITFWDRSTLYALRGVFAAGETERALAFLQRYSRRRLLGDHVPYAVEAYPEGNQRHLAAESALYCRIYTEGLFGLRPVGLRAFTLTPRLPAGWPEMALQRVHAFGATFDIAVKRDGANVVTEVRRDGAAPQRFTTRAGETVTVQF